MFLSFQQPLRRTRHDGLEKIKAAEVLYDRLMSYRYYRLIVNINSYLHHHSVQLTDN